MDQQRFDELVRNLGASNSRRTVLKGLLAGAVGGAISLVGGGGAFAKQDDSKKDKKDNKGHSKKPDCCPESFPSLCDLQCVDTDTDPRNCGVCGNDCGANGACVNGVCTCTDGTTQCNGTCVDTSSDANNCGACGNVCAADQTCQGGQCVSTGCTGGLTDCNGTCVDLISNMNNCGTCGHACGECFQACAASACVPSAAGTTCSGGTCDGNGNCVGNPGCTNGDVRACPGGLSVGVCTPGTQTCQLDGTWGECIGQVGPRSETCNGLDDDCDGVVDNGFDLQTDPNNCGACGHVCAANESCVGGSCLVCDDGNVCTTDEIDQSTGICVHNPVLSGTTCEADSCVPGDMLQKCQCDGNGGCFCFQQSCLPYNCVGNACATSCASDFECDGGHYCIVADGVCAPKRPAGASCSANDQCLSGTCAVDTCTS